MRKRRSAPLDAPDSAVAAIDERTVVGLRRSVAGEVALGLAVLVVTAVLVNAQPARERADTRAVLRLGQRGHGQSAMTINVTVDPARVGVNEIHVYTLTPKGADLAVRDISAKLVERGRHVGPREPRARRAESLPVERGGDPGAGKYQMLVQVLQVIDGRLVDTAGVTTVPVR